MKIGESLVDFLGRIKALINEAIQLGEVMTEEQTKIAITQKLRPALRNAADEKMDRDPGISLEDLMSYLISKQKKDKDEIETQAVFVAGAGSGEAQRGPGRGGGTRGGRQQGRGRGRQGRFTREGGCGSHCGYKCKQYEQIMGGSSRQLNSSVFCWKKVFLMQLLLHILLSTRAKLKG